MADWGGIPEIKTAGERFVTRRIAGRMTTKFDLQGNGTSVGAFLANNAQAGNIGRLSRGADREPLPQLNYVDIPVSVTVSGGPRPDGCVTCGAAGASLYFQVWRALFVAVAT